MGAGQDQVRKEASQRRKSQYRRLPSGLTIARALRRKSYKVSGLEATG